MTRLLQLFFKLLYNQFARFYDFVAAFVSTGLWKAWIFSILTDELQPPILEVGFGPGHLLKKLSGRGIQAYGLDASLTMSRMAFRKVASFGKAPVMVNGYAQFMPFFPGCFNHILTTFPADFILEEATWQEFNRVLSPTGRVTWLPVAWITSKSPISRAAAWLFRVTHQSPDELTEFDPDRFALLTRSGFDVTLEYRDLDRSKVLIIHAQKVAMEVEPHA